MRTSAFCILAVGIAGHAGVLAQPTASSTAVDFFGIYEAAPFVGTPEVEQPDEYPFTPQGQRAFAAYDAIEADPRQTNDCAPEAMPGILWSGNPMQIGAQGATIVMRYERGNTLRTIHMDGRAAPANEPRSLLGYSVGRWVNDVLTIETTHMTGGAIFNNRGYHLSADARLTERYWREPGEDDLNLELLVEDPVNYTQAFTLRRPWVWAPHEQLREWVCVDLGPGDAEPDIDELTRILQQL